MDFKFIRKNVQTSTLKIKIFKLSIHLFEWDFLTSCANMLIFLNAF